MLVERISGKDGEGYYFYFVFKITPLLGKGYVLLFCPQSVVCFHYRLCINIINFISQIIVVVLVTARLNVE